jgi:hypothetical protein
MMRFQVLTAASAKITGFWVVAPYSVAEVCRLSRVVAASIIALMMEAANTCETSLNLYTDYTAQRPRR